MYQFNTINPAIIAQNRSIIKAFLRKPVILIYALLSLCGLGISVSNLIINIPTLKSLSAAMIIDLHDIFDKNSTIYVDTSATDISFMVTAVITAVIGLLFVAPLFMIFFKSLSKKHESSPSAGLTILKVLAIIGIILTSFTLLYVIIASLAIILSMVYSNVPAKETVEIVTGIGTTISTDGQTFFIGVTVLFSVFVLAVIFALIWIISQLRFISSLKRGINTASPLKASGAIPIAVLSIIFAIPTAFSLFTTLTLKSSLESSADLIKALIPETYNVLLANSDFSSTYFIFMVASTTISLLTYILSFIIAIIYRKHIKHSKAALPAVPSSNTSLNNNNNGGYYGDSYSNKDKVSAPKTNYTSTYNSSSPYNNTGNGYNQPNNTYNSYPGSYNPYNQPANSYNPQVNAYPPQNNFYTPPQEAPTASTEQTVLEPANEPAASEPAENTVTDAFDSNATNSSDSTPVTYYCENCGKPYTDGDAFCENCGYKLN